ncbi:MAG TPA: discoidin domain-containing protein, partial [Bryobacteraceae bacterium]|nr:discoidin domain-containing protein [Bryobacteraceae bacterium]
DMAAAAVVFAVFYWLEIWRESDNDRILIAVGLLGGYAYAIKSTAVVVLIYALAVVISRRRGSFLIPAMKICGCAAVMMLPWIVKNWIWLGDPIAPLGAAIFRNPNLDIHALHDWIRYLREYHLPTWRAWPLEVTVEGVLLQGPLGPVFLLAPIALLALRDRVGRRLLLAALIMMIPYPMNIGSRFLLSALPFFALAMTLALRNFPRAISALVLAHAILSWPTIMAHYSAGWRIVHFPLRAALRIESESGFLTRSLDDYSIARMIDDRVPPGETVLALAGLPTAYIKHNVLIGYEASFNRALTDMVYTSYNTGLRPVVGLTFQFPEQSTRRVRVVQTSRSADPHQWNVSELRFFDHGVELARSSEWRVSAWPNPWQVQFAFDNSPATRWRSGEAPFPGMWIDADFGEARNLDQVEIQETPDGMWAVTLQVETMEASGKWVKRADNPKLHELPAPKGLARAATHEIYARGVHYMVVRDSDFGADDFADDPAGFGLDTVARTGATTLYHILP